MKPPDSIFDEGRYWVYGVILFHFKNAVHTMEKKLKPPYLKNVGHRGKISIWTVDGTYVRTHLDEEFTNYGQHYAFKCIPENEFWLDKEAENDEQRFFIDHLLTEHKLMVKGVPYDDALEAADKIEMAERKKSGDVRKLSKGGNLPDPKKVHVRLWKKLESGLSVWIVNGLSLIHISEPTRLGMISYAVFCLK